MTAPRTTTVPLGERSYPVLVGRQILAELDQHLDLPAAGTRALLVTQQAVVDAGHASPVEQALARAGIDVHTHLLPEGESAKDAAHLLALWRQAAGIPLSRDDLVVAVGGGVVGDVAGFAAATINRGIAVVQVPTTLLAQVDAAIGGKTGINLPEGKNLVGAFHQPLAVCCDVATLTTLPARLLTEGLGEVVKYGLIRDPVILELLETSTHVARDPDEQLLETLVARSVAVKAEVVGGDEREGGQRAFLNFGHTYGHVVEALTGYGTLLHGEAVAVGMVVALRLGQRLGHTPASVVERAETLLAGLGLPVRGPVLDRASVWTVMGRDKKAKAAGVRFVILDDLAAPRVVTPDRGDVDAVLDEFDAER